MAPQRSARSRIRRSSSGLTKRALTTVASIFARDYPTVQGLVIVFALLFALVNLAIDLVYGVIDPRVRYG